jgi:hypothetical protein
MKKPPNLLKPLDHATRYASIIRGPCALALNSRFGSILLKKLASAVDGKNLRSLREFPTKGAEGVHRWNVRLTQVVWLRLIANIEPSVGVIGQSTKIGRQRESEFSTE